MCLRLRRRDPQVIQVRRFDGAIIIRAGEWPDERYKIRSISLSVLNTTETNLDTSLFGVIRLDRSPPPPLDQIYSPHSSSGPRALSFGLFLIAGPADKTPAFSGRRRHFETHASSIKQPLHSSPINLPPTTTAAAAATSTRRKDN